MSLDVSHPVEWTREQLCAQVLRGYRERNRARSRGDHAGAKRAEDRMNWFLDLLAAIAAPPDPPVCPSARTPEDG